jgi:hypothetical protein
VVEVDQAVFAAKPLEELARIILQGAVRMGPYSAGLLILPGPGEPRVGAATGLFEGLEGRTVPIELMVRAPTRLSTEQTARLAGELGVTLPKRGVYLVPLTAPPAELGTLCCWMPTTSLPTTG